MTYMSTNRLQLSNVDYLMYRFTNKLGWNIDHNILFYHVQSCFTYSSNLLDLIHFIYVSGKEKLGYPMDKAVYVVLEEDGTEVDEEEYFQTLPENTLLMLLYVGGDKWSPYGLPFK